MRRAVKAYLSSFPHRLLAGVLLFPLVAICAVGWLVVVLAIQSGFEWLAGSPASVSPHQELHWFAALVLVVAPVASGYWLFLRVGSLLERHLRRQEQARGSHGAA